MMGTAGGLTSILNEAFGWLGVFIEIAGLVVCVRYARLSSSMPILVLAFAGFAAAGIGFKLFAYAVNSNVLDDEIWTGIAFVLGLVNVASTGALVLGLWLVFHDLRERFHFLGEVHRSTRDRTLAETVEIPPDKEA